MYTLTMVDVSVRYQRQWYRYAELVVTLDARTPEDAEQEVESLKPWYLAKSYVVHTNAA